MASVAHIPFHDRVSQRTLIVLSSEDVPDVQVGFKSWCTDGRAGYFLLQKGAGCLATLSCTHTGSGHLQWWDALTVEEIISGRAKKLFPLTPAILGCWMPNAGFNKGLIVEVHGHASSIPQAHMGFYPVAKRNA